MFLVGLTGGIGTGKSAVAKMMLELGVAVVDADQIARDVVKPGTKAWNQIKVMFGDYVFLENGEIDRIRLGRIVFSDAEKRKLINKITHPQIYSQMRRQVLRHILRGTQFVVLDLPLLFETRKALPFIHKTIVVSCDSEQQLSRVMARNNFSKTETESRVASQMSLEEKCSIADFVIENSGSLVNTRRQVEEIIQLLRSSNQHIWNRVICGGLLLLGLVIPFLIYFFFF